MKLGKRIIDRQQMKNSPQKFPSTHTHKHTHTHTHTHLKKKTLLTIMCVPRLCATSTEFNLCLILSFAVLVSLRSVHLLVSLFLL